MIQLTNKTRENKDGETVDDSIYIDKYDSRNMVITKFGPIDKKTGKPVKRVLGYYSNISTLLKHSVDFVIKDSLQAVELATMKDMIDNHIKKIDDICKDMPTMFELMKGTK